MPSVIVPELALALGVESAVGIALLEIGTGFAVSTTANLLIASQQKRPGITTQFTGRGDVTGQTIFVGRYATDGHQIAPPYRHQKLAKNGNYGETGYGNMSTYLINLVDIPITGLVQLYVDGQRFDLTTHLTGPVHPHYGLSVAEGVDRDDFVGRLWVKFYDGSQTVADPYLLGAYGSHTSRPWLATSVHRGGAYAIVTTKTKGTIFRSPPTIRWDLNGARLLDTRTGNTAFTRNPIVQAYNIVNGIDLPDGRKYRVGDLDLPADYWHTAMDDCDVLVAKADGGTEPAYRAALEIPIATPDSGGLDPLSALDEILRACAGQVADVGGSLVVRVGAPKTSVLSITDDDILNSQEQSYEPFDGLGEAINAVKATYPAPSAQWEAVESPLFKDDDAIAEEGEEFVANLQLNACPYPEQVQRICQAALKDAQRRRIHTIALPMRLDRVVPLDTITLTSEVHNYTNKLFEVAEYRPDLMTGNFVIVIREVDPADWVPNPANILPYERDEVARPYPSPLDLVPLADRGADNAGFEYGTDGQLGAPREWEFNSADPAALTFCGYRGGDDVDPASQYDSLLAYGALTIGGGRWWSLTKYFEIEEGQAVNIGCAVRLSSPVTVPLATGQNGNFIDEDDMLAVITFYNQRGGNLGIFAPRGASSRHWELNGEGPGALEWFSFDHPSITAPAGSAYFKVDLVAVDADGTIVSARIDYQTWSTGNAVILIDDVTFDVDGEPATPLSKKGFSTLVDLGQTVQGKVAVTNGITYLELYDFVDIDGTALPDVITAREENIDIDAVSVEDVFGSTADISPPVSITNADTGYVAITAAAQAVNPLEGYKPQFSLFLDFTVTGHTSGAVSFSVKVGRKTYPVMVSGNGTFDYHGPSYVNASSGTLSLIIEADGSLLPAGVTVTFSKAYHNTITLKR